MEYCRSLQFQQDPNYRTCVNFFEHCMNRNNLDGRIMDFTWKQNRLSKDKEALKNSMLNVIRKKPKMQAQKEEQADAGDQGYGMTAKKEERGMIHDNLVQQSSVPDPTADATKRASAAANKQAANKMNRGSEFKKTAQQMIMNNNM